MSIIQTLQSSVGALYKIALNKKKESINGIVIACGDEWSLFHDNPGDYLIDGYILINNKHIRKLIRTDKENFAEKVIKSKQINFGNNPQLSLDDNVKLFEELKSFDLIQFDNYRDDVTFVGKIASINRKSVCISLISPNAEWTGKDTYKFDEIWAIRLESDYVKSLTAYKNSQE